MSLLNESLRLVLRKKLNSRFELKQTGPQNQTQSTQSMRSPRPGMRLRGTPRFRRKGRQASGRSEGANFDTQALLAFGTVTSACPAPSHVLPLPRPACQAQCQRLHAGVRDVWSAGRSSRMGVEPALLLLKVGLSGSGKARRCKATSRWSIDRPLPQAVAGLDTQP